MKRIIILISAIITITYINTWADEETDAKIEQIIKQLTIEEKIRLLNSDDTISIERLSIPSYDWHNECLHGVIARNSTVFPQAIALAATWDINTMYEVATAISDEARIQYNRGTIGLNFWSPNLNLSRDPRWGRVQETYGEDPFLLSTMGYYFITGIQGDDPKYLKSIASPKHYLVHSGPEPDRHKFNAKVSEYDFRTTYLPGFETAFKKAKAYSCMSAYNAINDSAINASHYLLNDLLRGEFGFQGFVITDCGGLGDAYWGHKCTKYIADAPGMFLSAGVDMECGGFWQDQLYPSLLKGKVLESQIDTSLKRLFRARFKLGLFDDYNAVKYNFIPDSLLGSYKHVKISERAAEKSIVLLKNINNTLPLKKSIKNLFITGPLSNVFADLWGNYSCWQDSTVRILQGIKNAVSDSTIVRYDKASDLLGYMTVSLDNYTVKTSNGKTGIEVEYFDNMYLSGSPLLTRTETNVDFKYGVTQLPSSFPKDSFSIRYKTNLQVNKSCEYTFSLVSDDGAILIINGDTLIYDWSPHGYRGAKEIIRLNKDSIYSVVVEYYQKRYGAQLLLELGNEETIDYDLIKMLKDTASISDAIIFVGGINYGLESEESHLDIEGFYKGDRTNINLPITQSKIIKVLKESGQPVILILIGGSCLAVNWENENLDAILQVWYPGQTAGDAIAHVLFGDYNPAGRLPITYYKSSDDLPAFSDYNMSGRTYRYFDKEVLYPFGYGLSYTKFEYSNLILPTNIIDCCHTDSIDIVFNIKNIGKYKGDEVPQLYIKNLDSKIAREIKSLKGFNRVNINADETISDTIKLLVSDLRVYDTVNNKYKVESGKYKIEIGASSRDIRLNGEIELLSCSSGSIEENQLPELIYPNPADEIIKFKLCPSLNQEWEIRLINSVGEKIYQGSQIIDYNDIISIDVSQYPQGVYVAEIINSGKKYFKSFVISR